MVKENASFSFGLCVTSLVMTGGALTLALLAAQWGAGVPKPDALGYAFSYVMVALGGVWLLAWPAKAMFRATSSAAISDLLAIILGAMPAVGVAWFLAAVSLKGLGYASALQGALGLLALGVLSCRGKSATRSAWLAMLLAGGLLVGPLLWYLQAEFVPKLSDSLGYAMYWLPGIVLADGAPDVTTLWLIVATWGVLGLALWAMSAWLGGRADETAHQ